MVEKKNWISLVSVAAIVGVVYLHVNECFWVYSRDAYWISANIIETLFYASVPLFFMVSGETLLDYPEKYNTITYFKKRIFKTVIPYFFWCIVNYIFNAWLFQGSFDARDFFAKVFSGSIIGIFWFFPILFAIYLIIPVLANLKNKKYMLTYIAVIIAIITFGIPHINNVLGYNILFLSYSSGLEGYILFIILGYLIGHYDIKKSHRMCIYVFAIIAFLIMLIGTYVLSYQAGDVSKRFKGYTNEYSFIYAIGIYVFLKQLGIRMNQRFANAINGLKDYTFGIFLTHMFVLLCVRRVFKLAGIAYTSLFYRLVAPPIIIIICIIIIKIIRKIPGGKIVLPK